MIGMVKGTVELRDESSLIVDVSGVGYNVFVPLSLLTKLAKGAEAKLFTYTHVREDALELFGFEAYSDLKLFELLIGVSGVGPKTALGIFSVGSRQDIMNAIATGNVEFFTSVPRLGRKNAQKIIIELKNRVGSTVELDLTTRDSGELVAALRAFGFTTAETLAAARNAKTNGKTLEEQVKLALKYLGK